MLAKRIFDLLLSVIALLCIFWLLIIFYLFASIDTQSNGFFLQKRIGRFGKSFTILKFKTLHAKTRHISNFGKILRYFKIDELPQLLNVFIGDMSFVGPRPDLPGYYDKLEGENKLILKLKPGITSEASIKYRNEEQLLAKQINPGQYNDDVIFPDKVKMNLDYYYHRTFLGDIKIIIKTFIK
jgi:lipopolysaccharide/colanic/teichoic acid biosynthesis glycosyltransferase